MPVAFIDRRSPREERILQKNSGPLGSSSAPARMHPVPATRYSVVLALGSQQYERDVVVGQNVFVDEPHQRSVADAALLRGLAQRQDVGVQIRFVSLADCSVSFARGPPAIASVTCPCRVSAYLTEHVCNPVVTVSVYHSFNQFDIVQGCLVRNCAR